jgi:hypothetical protein
VLMGVVDMLSAEELRHRLRTNDWFRGCSDTLQDALIAHGRERRLSASEPLFRQGLADGGSMRFWVVPLACRRWTRRTRRRF